MSRWSWADVWPGSRVVTLVLDEWEAEQLLGQAAEEGRLVGRNVIRGLPDVAMADPEPARPGARDFDDGAPSLRRPPDPVDLDAWRGLGRTIAGKALPAAPSLPLAVEAPAPEETSAPAPAAIVIFPGVRRERLADGPKAPAADTAGKQRRNHIRGNGKAGAAAKPAAVPLRPKSARPVLPASAHADNPPAAIKTVDQATRALIDAAVAEGRVTKCPPCTFARDANDPAATAWKRSGPAGKTAKVAAARAKAKAARQDD